MKTKKNTLLFDFTGDPEESHRRHVAGDDVINKVTKTDETDNKTFKESYTYNDAIKYLRSISNK